MSDLWIITATLAVSALFFILGYLSTSRDRPSRAERRADDYARASEQAGFDYARSLHHINAYTLEELANAKSPNETFANGMKRYVRSQS